MFCAYLCAYLIYVNITCVSIITFKAPQISTASSSSTTTTRKYSVCMMSLITGANITSRQPIVVSQNFSSATYIYGTLLISTQKTSTRWWRLCSVLGVVRKKKSEIYFHCIQLILKLIAIHKSDMICNLF